MFEEAIQRLYDEALRGNADDVHRLDILKSRALNGDEQAYNALRRAANWTEFFEGLQGSTGS